jgi:hypothetical protein
MAPFQGPPNDAPARWALGRAHGAAWHRNSPRARMFADLQSTGGRRNSTARSDWTSSSWQRGMSTGSGRWRVQTCPLRRPLIHYHIHIPAVDGESLPRCVAGRFWCLGSYGLRHQYPSKSQTQVPGLKARHTMVCLDGETEAGASGPDR